MDIFNKESNSHSDSLSKSDISLDITPKSEEFITIIPDFQANYYNNPHSGSIWLKKITRNLTFNLKYCFNLSLKRLYMITQNSVYLLGKEYKCKPPMKKIYKELKKNIKEIVWVTYRTGIREFEGEKGKVYNSDSGWGCTIRVGQMLLINCLKIHYKIENETISELLKTIEDNMENSPFSLRKLLSTDITKGPGEWFSPSEVSHMIVSVLSNHPLNNFKALVFMDSLILKDRLYSEACNISFEDIRKCCICSGISTSYSYICEVCNKPQLSFKWVNSLLIMLPLMLGVRKIQSNYIDSLKKIFQNKYSVGIIGGKLKSALYLAGIKNNSVIVFDPHYVQDASSSLSDFKRTLDTYFNPSLNTVEIENLESSMTVGFYFRNEEDFIDFSNQVVNEKELNNIIFIKNQTPDYLLDSFSAPDSMIIEFD
ncbi:hypothetical protein SteCoe_1640 [Stentor coeruleus]|uniref:Cysteine protease n=1 Tax=Stentor coeruleus TaxID=5963 RepID=A0A1R2D1F4_9CILI|nr:hypothetical protein SteCoe_1640 [Stentor coeruleus]